MPTRKSITEQGRRFLSRWMTGSQKGFIWHFIGFAAFILFAVEGIIMWILPRLAFLGDDPALQGTVDAGLLALTGGGLLVYFTLIPLHRALAAAKKAEQRAREALRGMQSRQEALDAYGQVSITDPDGRITYVNDSFVRISGYSRDEILGGTHRIVNSSYHPPEFFAEMFRTLARGEVWRGDIRNRARDGSFFWVDCIIYPVMDEAGQPVEYIATRIDITERKLLEQKLREERDRSRKNAMVKTQFLANMSHEIRTPMNGVMGMLDLVLDNNLPDDQRERIHIIQDSARTLLSLLNDILDISKLEAGKLTIESVVFEPRSVLGQVQALVEPRAREKDLEFRVEVGEAVPRRMLGDPVRIQQVLFNLICNAIKFTKKGGVRVEAACGGNGKEIEFRVHDSGIGIPDSVRKRLFRRFEQADNSTTTEFGGTGLGLAISKQLCELMGGSIGVDSIPGKGSTFRFRLPLKQIDAPETEASPTLTAAAAETETIPPGLRVLVAEDNKTNQVVARSMLRKLGLEARLASDGVEALDFLHREPFDLVLMDCRMPRKDGYQATRELRTSSGPNSGVHVIAVTANALPGDREACLEEGMDDYIAKPLSLNSLRGAIIGYLKTREPVSTG